MADYLVGEIRKAKDLGFKARGKLIWHTCEECGKERWVQLRGGQPKSILCLSCAHKRERCHTWKGGRMVNMAGYVSIQVLPSDFFYPMVMGNGYVLEHRLIMAKSLGRNLQRWEIVHHKNGIKDDNRIENLQLVSDDRHKQITILENRIAQLEKRVILLEVENIALRGTEVWTT